MEKIKLLIKGIKQIICCLMLGAIVLTTIVLYNNHGALPDALSGALITGGISGIIAIAMNAKEKIKE